MRGALFIACILFPLGQVPEPIPAPRPMDEPPLAGVELKLPPEVKAGVGDLVIIRAETNCKRATWILPPALKADPNEGGLKLTCTAPAGVYTLYCVTAPGVDQIQVAKTTLIIEGGTPSPPGPVNPPGPGPPGPAVDPFKAEVSALTKAASAADRKVAPVLASIYSLAAKEALNAGNTTLDDLLALISTAISGANGLGDGVLRPVRDRVRVELVRNIPDTSVDLTADVRKKTADIYGRAAAAIEEGLK